MQQINSSGSSLTPNTLKEDFLQCAKNPTAENIAILYNKYRLQIKLIKEQSELFKVVQKIFAEIDILNGEKQDINTTTIEWKLGEIQHMILFAQFLHDGIEVFGREIFPEEMLTEQKARMREFYQKYQGKIDELQDNPLFKGDTEMEERMEALKGFFEDVRERSQEQHDPAKYFPLPNSQESLLEKFMLILSNIINYSKEKLGLNEEFELEEVKKPEGKFVRMLRKIRENPHQHTLWSFKYEELMTKY